MKRLPAIARLIATGLAPVVAWAQPAPTELVGTIRRGSGVPAVGVNVVIEDEHGQTRATTQTSREGFYSIIGLPPGCYVVRVGNWPDYRPTVRTALIDANVESVVDVTLEFRVLKDEPVSVIADVVPGATSLAGATIGMTFAREEIERAAPTHGRNLQTFLARVPGIVFTDNTGTGAQFTSAGQRRFANRLIIDGVSGDLGVAIRGIAVGEPSSSALPAFAVSGGTQTLIPQAAIDEIQVRTTTSTPEHARSPGAQVMVTTRPGGSDVSGAAFLHGRPASWHASDWFSNRGQDDLTNFEGTAVQSSAYINMGASIGGPLIHKRLVAFGAWEQQETERLMTGTTDIASLSMRAASSPLVRPLLETFPMPTGPDRGAGLAELAYVVPVVTKLTAVSARLDSNLSEQHRVFGRFNHGRSRGVFFDPINNLPSVAYTRSEAATINTSTLGATSVLFQRFVHDLRVNLSLHRASHTYAPGVYDRPRDVDLSQLLPPNVAASDALVSVQFLSGRNNRTFAGAGGANAFQQVQLVDTWTMSRGRHEWRLGFDYRRLTGVGEPPQWSLQYRFRGAADLIRGQVQFVTATRFAPVRARIHSTALFLQDRFRISRLSIDVGIRYQVKPAPASLTSDAPLLFAFEALPELRTLPAGSRLWRTSWTDIGPHLAGTYRLSTSSGRATTLRGAWGLTYDEMMDSGTRAFGQGYPFQALTSALVQPVVPLPDAATSQLPSFESTVMADGFAFPRNFRTPRTTEWQAGLDQELGLHRLSVSYVGSSGRNLTYWHTYSAGDDLLHRVQAYSNSGASNYHALLIDYARRLSRGVQWHLAYAWSHAIDVDSGEAEYANWPPTVVAPILNRGSADFDRRHVLRVTASYPIPGVRRAPRWVTALLNDWQLDLVGAAISGAPINVVRVESLNHVVRPDIVPGVPLWIRDPTVATGRRLNRDAFVVPSVSNGTLGRNALRASMLRQIDLSLSRSVRLRGRLVAQVRVDAFNVFNIPNFAPPVVDLDEPGFGRPIKTYAQALGTGTLGFGGLTPIEQTGGPRSIQLGFRLGW